MQRTLRSKAGVEQIPVIEICMLLEEHCFNTALKENSMLDNCLWSNKDCVSLYQRYCEKLLSKLETKDHYNWHAVLTDNKQNPKMVEYFIMKDDDSTKKRSHYEQPYKPPREKAKKAPLSAEEVVAEQTNKQHNLNNAKKRKGAGGGGGSKLKKGRNKGGAAPMSPAEVVPVPVPAGGAAAEAADVTAAPTLAADAPAALQGEAAATAANAPATADEGDDGADVFGLVADLDLDMDDDIVGEEAWAATTQSLPVQVENTSAWQKAVPSGAPSSSSSSSSSGNNSNSNSSNSNSNSRSVGICTLLSVFIFNDTRS